MSSSARKCFAIALVGAVLATLVGSLGASASPAPKGKGKKVHACAIKKGADKGLMRFSPSGKCKRGEKKLSWGKRGKRGKRGKSGAAGATGATGAAGQDGGLTDELIVLLQQQQAAIDALCAQLSTVTTQVNSLATVISGLGLNSVLTTLGGLLTIPALPAPLDPFACP